MLNQTDSTGRAVPRESTFVADDDLNATAINIQRQVEQLRQEALLFNQKLIQDAKWFALRLGTSIAVVIMFPLLLFLCSWILLHENDYPITVVYSVSGALFVDILGFLLAAWKILLGPQHQGSLASVTIVRADQPTPSPQPPLRELLQPSPPEDARPLDAQWR